MDLRIEGLVRNYQEGGFTFGESPKDLGKVMEMLVAKEPEHNVLIEAQIDDEGSQYWRISNINLMKR